MSKTMDSYAFHKFPIACFATGCGPLDRVGVSAGSERGFCVYDLDKSSEDHNKEYSIGIGH